MRFTCGICFADTIVRHISGRDRSSPSRDQQDDVGQSDTDGSDERNATPPGDRKRGQQPHQDERGQRRRSGDAGTQRDDQRPSDQHRRGHGGEQPRADPVRQSTDAGGLVVAEVGQHVEQVCTDTEQRRRERRPPRRQLGGRPARDTNTTSPPKEKAYGAQDHTVDFSPAL